MKNKVYALYIASIVVVSLLCVPGFSTVNNPSTLVVEIENYEQLQPYIKEVKLICYSERNMPITDTATRLILDPRLIVPFDTVKIGFIDTILTGETFPIDLKNKKLSIPIKTKFFIPIDGQSKAPLDEVGFSICTKNGSNHKILTEETVFKKNNQRIEVVYPAASKNLLLCLRKEGYKDWEGEISNSFFKNAHETNSIEMKKLTRVTFSIENGGGAKVTVGDTVKNVDQSGKVCFDIDPNEEKEFIIIKEGFEKFRASFKPDKVGYEITLEPVPPAPTASQKPTTSPQTILAFTEIHISNETNYNGQVILTDNLGKTYTIPITQSAFQIEIEGKQITSARLAPEVLLENGKKYRIYPNKEGNGCKIIPIEEKILNFQFSIKTCGEKRPAQISMYLDGPLDQYGDPVKKTPIPFDIDPQKDDFQHSKAVSVDPRKPGITAYIMNSLEGKIPCRVGNNVVHVDIDLCKPALALVVFITNSRKALQKQDAVDMAIRKIFDLKQNYKDLYVAWVSYDKTTFQLNEFLNNNDRQINISDTNTNETAGTSLSRIIKYIETKFTGINVQKRKKQAADKLVIMLDKRTISDSGDYSSENLKVKLIDINDFITGSNEQFLNLIKED